MDAVCVVLSRALGAFGGKKCHFRGGSFLVIGMFGCSMVFCLGGIDGDVEVEHFDIVAVLVRYILLLAHV